MFFPDHRTGSWGWAPCQSCRVLAGLVLSAEGGTYLHGLLVYKRLWHRMASKWQVPKAGMRVLMLVGWMAFTKMSLHCISFVTVDTCHSWAILISTVAHKALTEKSLFSPHSGKKLTQGHRVLWRLKDTHVLGVPPCVCTCAPPAGPTCPLKQLQDRVDTPAGGQIPFHLKHTMVLFPRPIYLGMYR